MARPVRHAFFTAPYLVLALAAAAWGAEPADAVPARAEAATPTVPDASAAPPGPGTAAADPGASPGSAPPSGTRARLIKATTPPIPYPGRALRRRQDGWVQLSFTITADGTVTNPIVEDSSGVVEFERAAIESILKARYVPATWQGRPIEQCASRMLYQFAINDYSTRARPAFREPWQEAVQFAAEQRYAEAEAKLDEIDRNGSWSIYEVARMWLLRSSLQAAKGDKVGQLRSLRRATVMRGTGLDKNLYRQALLQRFALEVQLSQYGAALETHETMKELDPPLADPRVDKAVADIDRVIHGRDALGIPGVIEFRSGCEEGRPNWKHELLRRTFTFDDIEGKVDEFELRCDWKRVVDKVSTDKTWQVPVNWGWCQVFVFGEQGATVKLVELPLAAGEKGARPPRVRLD